MTVQQLTHKGIVTYWTPQETSVANLQAAMLEIGGETLRAFVPDASTPLTALRQALSTVYPERMIRKLKIDGLAVVKEDRGSKENEYEHLCSAWFEKTGDGPEDFEIKTAGTSATREILREYHANRGVLQPSQVGRFLSRVLQEYLKGTPLRPNGGVYWLPAEKFEIWQQISNASERASAEPKKPSAVYILKHDLDDAAVRAVRDAIINEMDTESDRIMRELAEGELGERAIETREHEVSGLLEKVKYYEGILKSEISSVHAVLGKTQDAVAAAKLLASAGKNDTVFANSEN